MSPRARNGAQVIQTVRASIHAHRLLPEGWRVLVAVSGGQDSLTLSEGLSEINRKHGPTGLWSKLSLAHCDHRWPGDEGISTHVAEYASSRGLPLHIIAASPPPRMTEAAGRNWRYDALSQLALSEGYDAVVTGHTATDLAETVVYALAMGAGSDGLGSLSWTRRLVDGVELVRPMLGVSRSETAAFCEMRDIRVWHDIYNDVDRYARNRVRKEVVPLLRDTLNPRVEEALTRTAHLLRDDAAELERTAARVHRLVVEDANETTSGHAKPRAVIRVDRRRLRKESVAIQRRVLRRVLRAFVGVPHHGAMFKQVESVLVLMYADVGATAPSLSRGAEAVVEDDAHIAFRLQHGLLAADSAAASSALEAKPAGGLPWERPLITPAAKATG